MFFLNLLRLKPRKNKFKPLTIGRFDVPGHPAGDPTHVTYSWKVYTSDYRTKWMVYNFDNAAEHTEHVLSFVNEVHFDDTFTFDDSWWRRWLASLAIPRQALSRYPSRTAAQPVAATHCRVVAAVAEIQAGLCLAARLGLGRCPAERLVRHCRPSSAAAPRRMRTDDACFGRGRIHRAQLDCGRSRPRLDSGRQPLLFE